MHIIVPLGRWEGFTATLGEADGGTLTEVITQILGEGGLSLGPGLICPAEQSPGPRH